MSKGKLDFQPGQLLSVNHAAGGCGMYQEGCSLFKELCKELWASAAEGGQEATPLSLAWEIFLGLLGPQKSLSRGKPFCSFFVTLHCRIQFHSHKSAIKIVGWETPGSLAAVHFCMAFKSCQGRHLPRCCNSFCGLNTSLSCVDTACPIFPVIRIQGSCNSPLIQRG